MSGLEFRDQFDVRVLSADEARAAVGHGADLRAGADTVRLLGEAAGAGQGALRPGQVTRPVITISDQSPGRRTRLRASPGWRWARRVNEINSKIGQQMSAQVAKASGAPLPGGVALALTSPVDVQVNDFDPLPERHRQRVVGVLLRAAVVARRFHRQHRRRARWSTRCSALCPPSWAPFYRFAETVKISRFRTLLVKWALMVVDGRCSRLRPISVSPLVGHADTRTRGRCGLYGAFTIAAVGITSTSLIAVLGSVGLLVNLFIFVMLGLPSNGATIPLEALPRSSGGWRSSNLCTRSSSARGRCFTSTAAPTPGSRGHVDDDGHRPGPRAPGRRCASPASTTARAFTAATTVDREPVRAELAETG